MENIIIPDPKDLEKKIAEIKADGVEKLHVLSDFDRTLTKAFIDGKKTATVIAQIRNGHYISEEYTKKAHELYDRFHPIEIDPTLTYKYKSQMMNKWWEAHFSLLIECGLDKKVMQDITDKESLDLRHGTFDLFDKLNINNIPLILMSAGPGDMIKLYLRKENYLLDNMSIIANFFEFNKNGKVVRVKRPIIHSLNKHEIELKKLPVYTELKKRKNVILLGDTLEDIGMVEGFQYKTLIKIGFLNEEIEKNLSAYKKSYDIILLNDSDMDYINELLDKII